MPRNRDFEDDFEDDDEEDRQPLEGERLVKHLRRQVKERDKRLSDIEKELTEFRAERRTRTVASVLEGRGVNPKYARFITRDLEDPTEDAVSKWLDENADLVGLDKQDTTVDEDSQRALRKFADADRGAKPAVEADPIAARLSDPNLTPEQLAEIIGKPLVG